jgi:predicted ribosome quality control (RQC) complex YloA/Tae2 family protein
MNHFLLHLLVREIAAELPGRKIRSIRLLHPIVSIELAERSSRRYLVVLLSTPGPYCYYGSDDPLGSVGAAVLKRVHGARVTAAPELPGDRVIRLAIDRAGDTSVLTVSLYGSSAKIRVQAPDHIIESLDSTESGMLLREPSRRGAEPFALVDSSSAGAAVSATREVSRIAPGLEPALADCFADEDGIIDSVALFRFRDAVLAGESPFALATGGRLGRVTPMPVETLASGELEHRYGPFDCAVEACRAVGEVLMQGAREAILDRYRGALTRYVTKRGRLLKSLEDDLLAAKNYDDGRNQADILAAYQSQIPPGAREIELPDLYAPGQNRIIRLDPSLPVGVQIRKRYKRAAKLERSRDVLNDRIRVVDRDISKITKILDRAEKATAFDTALELLQSTSREYRLSRQVRRGPSEGMSVKQHRRFELDNGWFALVGRSDRENDEITFRVSTPDDVWLHAQQVAGSHVVLRSSGAAGNPPAAVLEAAAAIAAFYSKARHSNLVPVIYTQRRYVRKFRGAKPGQVTCEREKTIFVEPKLPEE